MPRLSLRRVLGALLPGAIRRDLFEPAVHDLDGDRMRSGRPRARAAMLWLFLDCWRLAPAEVGAMFFRDLRHAFRLLRRDLGFTVTAVLTLTLGVGANVAVFAVFNAVLLRPLPYADAEDLVMVQHRDRRTGITKEFIAIGDFVDMHARQQAFEAIAPYGTTRTVVHTQTEPRDAVALQATPELLSNLRVVPFAGRGIEDADTRPGSAPVAMLGYDIWQAEFGGDPGIVGRSVKIGMTAVPRQIVGIAPPGFRFPAAAAKTDVIFPMTVPASAPAGRKNSWTFAVARLKPGVSREQGAAHLAALSQQMEQEHPDQNQGSEYFPVPMRDAMIGETRDALMLTLAAVTLVLLIACANVANLLAARSLARRQEMSLRVALGAGRRQLVVQLVAEALALAFVSGVAAVLFAAWATPALVSRLPRSLNLTALGDVRLDPMVLGFAGALTVGTTIVFSIFSGLAARRNDPGALVGQTRVSSGVAVRRATSTLVAAEIALAIVLLTSAGLVLRSFANLLSVDPGFRPSNVLTLNINAPADRYREVGARVEFQRRTFAAIKGVPGVEEVGAGAVIPLTGNNWTGPFERADQPVPAGQRPPDVGWQSATGGYFRAMGIPLLSGRFFSEQDGPSAPAVVIISKAVEDRFFPGGSAVGHKVRLQDEEAEIVGVVGNIRRAALTDSPRADMYFPQEHTPGIATTLFIRTSGDPAAIVPAVRTALRGVEPSIVMRGIITMDDVARESMQVTRLALWLLGLFAAIAVALAAVGIYGVMAYTVRQRMREIGTRVALGATRANILWLVLGQGGRLAVIGTAAGIAISLMAGRALRTLLFSTTPGDPVILAASAALLLLTALAACFIPARRATRVDPMKTLSTF